MKFALTVNCPVQFCVAVFLKQQKYFAVFLLFMWEKKSLKENKQVPSKVSASFLYFSEDRAAVCWTRSFAEYYSKCDKMKKTETW